jgi:acetate kinase
MEFFGIKIDEAVNATVFGEEKVISTPDSRVKVIVVPTDEEFMIASDTLEIAGK